MSTPFSIIKNANLGWRGNIPFSNDFADIYFSLEDGFAEKKHVFIEGNDLLARWRLLSSSSKETFNIAEIGFGTGLNFLATWHHWRTLSLSNKRLYYFSCEMLPLSRTDLVRCSRNWPLLAPLAVELIHKYPVLTPGFHYIDFPEDRIALVLMLGDAKECLQRLLLSGDDQFDKKFTTNIMDCWFLDGFNPAKNERVWSKEICQLIASLSAQGTSLSSFSTARIIKDNLNAVGFSYVKKPGFAQKKEILCARYTHPSANFRKRKTPWQTTPRYAYKHKKAIVIGAGLAGALMAHSLAKRNWQVTVMEEGGSAASKASANPQAILYPNLSAFKSPLTELMLNAFIYAAQFYRELDSRQQFGNFSGILQLIVHKKEERLWNSMSDWLTHYPELAKRVSSAEASCLAGIPLKDEAFFIPLSGSINCGKLCSILLEENAINLRTKSKVETISQQGNNWYVNDEWADVVIIATGAETHLLADLDFIPLKKIKGQISWVLASSETENLRIPLCGGAHILPARNGIHALGATFETRYSSLAPTAAADAANLDKLAEFPVDCEFSKMITGNWAGLRLATPDYLPLVGAVPEVDLFLKTFAGLQTDANRWLAEPGKFIRGLYLFTAFGSRGLTSAPLCAEWLAGNISNEPSILSRELVRAIAPARYLIRKLTRDL